MDNKDKNTVAAIAEQFLGIDDIDDNETDFECSAPDVGMALTAAFEAGMRAGAHQERLTHVSNRREQERINKMLGWLASNDPNGLWSEYLDNFVEASAEHGGLTSEDLKEVIEEMEE